MRLHFPHRPCGLDPALAAAGRHPAHLCRCASRRRCGPWRKSGREAGWDDANFEARLSAFLKLWSRTFRPGSARTFESHQFRFRTRAGNSGPALPAQGDLHVRDAAGFPGDPFWAPKTPPRSQDAGAGTRCAVEQTARRQHPPESLSDGRNGGDGLGLRNDGAGGGALKSACLWLDFERFLADPHGSLAECFDHLASPQTPSRSRPSPQAPTCAATPRRRNTTTTRSCARTSSRSPRQCGGEIKRGMDWLEKAAAKFPAIGAALVNQISWLAAACSSNVDASEGWSG